MEVRWRINLHIPFLETWYLPEDKEKRPINHRHSKRKQEAAVNNPRAWLSSLILWYGANQQLPEIQISQYPMPCISCELGQDITINRVIGS